MCKILFKNYCTSRKLKLNFRNKKIKKFKKFNKNKIKNKKTQKNYFEQNSKSKN